MDRDEMIERGARALIARYPCFDADDEATVTAIYADAAAVVDAITPDEYEPLNMRGGGPFLCRYHGNVDWCERDKPDRVPVYVKRTPPDAPEPEGTCGAVDSSLVAMHAEHPELGPVPSCTLERGHPTGWHQASDALGRVLAEWRGSAASSDSEPMCPVCDAWWPRRCKRHAVPASPTKENER